MEIARSASAPSPAHPMLRASALLLVVLALLGHLSAAYAIGGTRTAYTHHVLGFALILGVTGGGLALLGRRLWPTRRALTLLAIGALQALLGLWVALAPSSASVAP